MDIATIIGIVSGLILIVTAIMGNGELSTFIDVPSLMIVGGGMIAAIFVNFSLNEVLGVIGVVRKAFMQSQNQALDLIDMFVDLSKRARREGILAIDKAIARVDDDFMRNGLAMAVDGTEPETIREVMEAELNYVADRHKKGQQIFMSLGSYAPAFGMIGTLIGLINMLKGLDDPTSIGDGMAVALITTFYGSLFANLIFIPIAGKLKNKSDEEILIKELIIEGVLAIQYGEHPRNIGRKLLNFLPPKTRQQFNADAK